MKEPRTKSIMERKKKSVPFPEILNTTKCVLQDRNYDRFKVLTIHENASGLEKIAFLCNG